PVYLAEDMKHRRPVAVKVLSPELAAGLGTDRFLREIQIAARLTHPHILPLHDSGEADGLPYYVMPYVEGVSLRGRLIRERPLPIEDALRITREVADALDYAHKRDVVHRDIKPENILFQTGHAVVSDFGIARAINMAGKGRMTGTGIAIGTPGYMSPEQARGVDQLDGRSDVYSLGCVLFEMLAGDPPFPGWISREHFEQHAPKAVDIAAAVELVDPAGLLRTHVSRRADRNARPRHPALARHVDRAGDTEVAHHRMTGLEEDVLRFDVPMHDVPFVSVVQGIRHLARNAQRVLDRE